MSKELAWLLDGLYSTLDISGQRSTVKKCTKKSGTYTKNVSTDTTTNLNNSSVKVGNAMRKEMAAIS